MSAPPAPISPRMVGALAAVALLDGDVLNAAAALKDFTALKGRGARFEANGIAVIDDSYNRQPRRPWPPPCRCWARAKAAKSRCWATCWKWAGAASAHHAGLAAPIEANKVDLVFASGAQMKALWEALPASRRGAYAENSTLLAPKVMTAVKPGDTVLVKGSNGARMSVIIDAIRAGA